MTSRLAFWLLPGAVGACTTVLEYTSTPVDAGPTTLEQADATCGSSSDPSNCGRCGHSCLGGACVAGACQPVVLASEQGDSTGGGYYAENGAALSGPDRIATDGATVFWLDLSGVVMSIPTAGGVP